MLGPAYNEIYSTKNTSREKPQIHVLRLQLKKLLKEDQIKLKKTGQKEIISVKEEINEVKKSMK